jgi:hypothetical protein
MVEIRQHEQSSAYMDRKRRHPGYTVYWLLLLSLLWGVELPLAQPALLPFQEGEELTFAVHWLGIPVGTATLRVGMRTRVHGHDVIPLVSQARTAPFFSAVYAVDDRAESHFDAEQRDSRFYRIQQQEGRYRHYREVTFDQEQQRVTYRRNHLPPQILQTVAAVQDPLSALYLLRTFPLQVGASVSVPIFERGKTWITEVRVLKRERLSLPSGTMDTLKLQPLLQAAGILKREGALFIWVTDDAQHIPVRIQSSIAIGALTARLMTIRLSDSAWSKRVRNAKSEIATQ